MRRGLKGPFTSTVHQKYIRSLVIRDAVCEDMPDIVQNMMPQMPRLKAFTQAPLSLQPPHSPGMNLKADANTRAEPAGGMRPYQ